MLCEHRPNGVLTNRLSNAVGSTRFAVVAVVLGTVVNRRNASSRVYGGDLHDETEEVERKEEKRVRGRLTPDPMLGAALRGARRARGLAALLGFRARFCFFWGGALPRPNVTIWALF